MTAEPKPLEGRPLTGRKVLLMMVAGFAVIVGANLTMLFAATGSFPGLVVANSYVASQGWDRKVAAQRALGWHAGAVYEGGRLAVSMTGPDGRPVAGLRIAAVIGRPASQAADVRLDLTEGPGGYSAPLDLAPGLWRVEITGTSAEGESYTAGAEFYVRAPG
jgi:nitrogen fixation protein FixH